VTSQFLEHWLEEVVATPGMTGIRDAAEARRRLLDDALRAAPIVGQVPGPVIDVGSGGGTPGIPLAAVLPTRAFTLLEAELRKCDFLERVTVGLTNVDVVWGRAEDQQTDAFGVAPAKALLRPWLPVWPCLPLLRPAGIPVVWVGGTPDGGSIAAVAERLEAVLEEDADGLAVLRKLRATPPGFPRRTGVAKKRPLA